MAENCREDRKLLNSNKKSYGFQPIKMKILEADKPPAYIIRFAKNYLNAVALMLEDADLVCTVSLEVGVSLRLK